jgi:hypothetical protein
MNLKNGCSDVVRKCALLCVAVFSLLALETPARANGVISLVTNGSFESTSLVGSGFLSNQGTAGACNVSGWTCTATDYSFLVFPGTAQTDIGNNVTLYKGITNIMPNSSPDGGNFVASDGAFQVGTISQQITGLQIGQFYNLTFWQAGAQQTTFTGTTTDRYQVSLLNASSVGQTFLSTLLSNPSHDFQPWELETMKFKATAVTETLSFMAVGTPTGTPPFTLLDGVSLTEAPEPAGWAFMGLGLASLAVLRNRKKRV